MLHAHSLTEAQLYLRITGCAKCQSGTSFPPGAMRSHNETHRTTTVRVQGQCPACASPQEMDFEIDADRAASAPEVPPAINTTDERSSIIDLGQWLTLTQLFIQDGRSEPDRRRVRVSQLQAAQCLDEALKFYDDPDNDLPPADSFYTDSSRRRFHESPQQFSRNRIIGERRKLPVPFEGPDA